MKIHSVLTTLALIGICNIAFAQWQWLDNEGRKVYSDRAPPLDVPAKNILKRAAAAPKATQASNPIAAEAGTATAATPAAVSSSAAGNGLDKELAAKKKLAAEAEAAKRRADEERITKAKIENCARAKQSQATYDSGVRISRTNAAGEREIMDDPARAAERARIQAIIDSDCR